MRNQEAPSRRGHIRRVFFYISYPKISARVGNGVPKQGRKSEAVLYERLFILTMQVHCFITTPENRELERASGLWRGERGACGTRAPALLVGTACLCPPHGFALSVNPTFLISCETALFFSHAFLLFFIFL